MARLLSSGLLGRTTPALFRNQFAAGSSGASAMMMGRTAPFAFAPSLCLAMGGAHTSSSAAALRQQLRFAASAPQPQEAAAAAAEPSMAASACPFTGGASGGDGGGGGCPFSGGGSSSPAVDANGNPIAGGASGCPMSIASALPKGMACPVEDPQQVTLQATLMSLGKFKLSGFISATAVCGYVLAGGMNPLIAVAVGVGTQLQSMSACTANQIWEVKYDKMMKRTAKRPLVANHCSKEMATAACVAEMVAGSALLGVLSPYAAGLGALNWFLYVCMYTPLKRVSAVNTWFGAIVGGIPPLMGGVAASGTLALTPATGPMYLLGAYMLVWQIPHFMALSFHCRRDYESAGFKMLAFANPWRASFWAVALSVGMVLITLLGPWLVGWETELWYYPVVALPGLGMIQKSVLFHNDPIRHCRGCFLFSYAYLGICLLAFSANHVQPMHNAALAIKWAQARLGNNNSEAKEEGGLTPAEADIAASVVATVATAKV